MFKWYVIEFFPILSFMFRYLILAYRLEFNLLFVSSFKLLSNCSQRIIETV